MSRGNGYPGPDAAIFFGNFEMIQVLNATTAQAGSLIRD